MKKTTDLQEQLNQAAEKRLDQDIEQLCRTLRSLPIIMATDESMPRIYEKQVRNEGDERPVGYDSTTPYWLFRPESLFMRQLKENLLPRYQAEQATLFIEKVERLESEIINLYDITEHKADRSRNDY